MENLSGLQESIFSLFRGLQLNSHKKIKKIVEYIKFIDFPHFPWWRARCPESPGSPFPPGLLGWMPAVPAVPEDMPAWTAATTVEAAAERGMGIGGNIKK